ncbi:MAG: hypothetical protein PHE89_05865 [Alphaproteobacteria bacterium]|nr:hypothetical protein [Alphaproteobacteria bacterium]
MKKSYFIFLGAFLLFCASFTLTYDAFAGVYFITKPNETINGTNNKPCQIMGFKVLAEECQDGQKLFDKCPTGDFYKTCRCETEKLTYTTENCTKKDSKKELSGASCKDIYFEKCECKAQYKYTAADCAKDGKIQDTDQCDGKSTACVCDSKYQYSASNCTANLGGGSCGGKYETCSCPSNYSSCSCGGYSGECTLNGVTKYRYCNSCCSDSCSSGSTWVSCSGSETKTYTGETECGSSCYKCVNDTCSSGSKSSPCRSDQNPKQVSTTGAGTACYSTDSSTCTCKEIYAGTQSYKGWCDFIGGTESGKGVYKTIWCGKQYKMCDDGTPVSKSWHESTKVTKRFSTVDSSGNLRYEAQTECEDYRATREQWCYD